MKQIIRQSSFALALATALWVPHRLQPALQTNSIPTQTNTNQLSEQFMALQQKSAADMAIQDEQLRQLVTQMNTAPAEQKVDAVAAVVGKLVEQQLASHQRSQIIGLVQTLMQGLVDMETNGTQQVSNPTSPPMNSQPVTPPQTQSVQPSPARGVQPVPPQTDQTAPPQIPPR